MRCVRDQVQQNGTKSCKGYKLQRNVSESKTKYRSRLKNKENLEME